MIASRPGRLWPALAAALLLTGCGQPSPDPQLAAATAPPPSRSQSRLARIDVALAAAADYLAAAQSADGSWKSDVYGQFKQGDAITPLVLMTLGDLPDAPLRTQPIDRGTRYLEQFVGEDGSIRQTDPALTYPVYTAACAVVALSRQSHGASRDAFQPWLKYLRDQQLAEPLGWQPDDAQYGGWSYAKDLP